MNEIVKSLKTRFRILDEHYQREDETFITVEKDQAISVVTHLRDYEGFSHLVLLTAVDWLEDGVFQLSYILNNPLKKVDIVVKTMIARENATMTSSHHLWAAMATYQRELYEMFGIEFPGSPRMTEPFCLEGWNDLPPYRRDFDTEAYSNKTYFPRPGRETHDPGEHMKKNMYPEEGDK